MSEADPILPSKSDDERAAYRAWLNAELKKGLESGISERTPRQIFDDFWKRHEAPKG